MRALVIFALIVFLAFPAYGAFVGGNQGGYAGPDVDNSTTVKAVKGMRDDTFVTLTGRIVSRIGGDKYVFQDATGQITVDIDDEDFRGQTVSPQNMVRITGEVEKEFGRATEVDVKSLQVLE